MGLSAAAGAAPAAARTSARAAARRAMRMGCSFGGMSSPRSMTRPDPRADPRRGNRPPHVPFLVRRAYCRAMHALPAQLRSQSGAEVKERLDAERRGTAFVLYRDGGGRQRIVALGPELRALSIGRTAASDIPLSWDAEVSRAHAVLERVGDAWTVVDDGLSRNGTYVNGDRIHGRRRLEHGDDLRLGETHLTYLHPEPERDDATITAADQTSAHDLSDLQRRVLLELARPYKDAPAFATPATNREIGDALYLSQDAVKGHLRALFRKFGVDELPQNTKRAALVERALMTGAVSRRKL